MSTPTAKDLLAQADRLMRQRTPEELPVLTDLVVEEIELTSLSDRMDEVIPTHARPSWMPALPPPPAAAKASVPPRVAPSAPAPVAVVAPPAPAPAPVVAAVAATPIAVASGVANSQVLADLFARRPRVPQDSQVAAIASPGANAQHASVNVREQFNEQLLAKLDELQHSVFSQVMQKLELYAAGSLKANLRETLEPALIGIARDLAEQVAEDTSAQVRSVVSDAVDAEIARLREQLSKKRP